MKVYSKNALAFNHTDILKYLNDFIKLYEKRPIKNNDGGMKFPQMFGTYYFLKKVKPSFVVESGVYKGQSTWLIEKTLPKAKIVCIDLNFSNLIYKSKKAKYSNIDFKDHEFDKINKNSLAFFDDHQNFLDRLIQAKKFNFKHILFEDNYAPNYGDCYSPKKIIYNSGNIREIYLNDIYKNTIKILKESFRKYLNKNYVPKINIENLKWNLKLDNIAPNIKHKKFFLKTIDIYKEFPPIFKKKYNRWGDLWDNEKYENEKPLLSEKFRKHYPLAYKDADSYTWLCYLKLK